MLLEKNRAIACYAKALELRNGKCFRKVTEEGYSGSRFSHIQNALNLFMGIHCCLYIFQEPKTDNRLREVCRAEASVRRASPPRGG